MCENGNCVLSASQCSAVAYSCSSTQVRCLDGSCVDEYAHCGMVEETNSQGVTEWVGSNSTLSCPSAAPAMCSNGACVISMADCSTNTDPATTTILGSSSASKKTSVTQVLCFDGSYRDSYQDCIAFAKTVYGDNSTNDDGSPYSTAGTSCTGFCPDGTCIVGDAAIADACAIVESCDVGYSRCYDGSCRLSCKTNSSSVASYDMFNAQAATESEEVSIAPAECNSDQELCIDGVCRELGECPLYNGCGYQPNYRYRCPSRECAADLASCTSAADRDAKDYAELLLHDTKVDTISDNTTGILSINEDAEDITLQTQSLLDTPNSVVHAMSVLSTTTSTTTSYKSCSSNCIADTSVYSTSILYDPTRAETTYTVAPLSTGFGIILSSGLAVNTDLDSNIYIKPVADSVYYNASNKVTYSRTSTFGSTLTAAQTVLSPVFSCSTGDGIAQPFTTNVGITSLFDRSASPQPVPEDVCLARLRRFPEHNYVTGQCLFNDTACKGSNTQYTIRQTTTAPINNATSYITT